ncbi:MAG: hypothetical protein GX102_09925 [Porphyromonadaceae bacterium]|nr:hypothetical protein [Porphyromonadaceae bacterium]
MTYEDFIQLINKPEKISADNQSALKEMIEKYPYFGVARQLYLRSLRISDSIYFQKELEKNSIYTSNRRNLYFFIHPEEKHNDEMIGKDRGDATGSYFDMLKVFEKNEEKKRGSLQKLAEKLRQAREIRSLEPEKSEENQKNEEVEHDLKDKNLQKEAEKEYQFILLENESKALIREQKYLEAIEILEKLNLINPKKSIYFADQIRFLKKIINN